MNPIIKVTHDGPRNAAIQITGQGGLEWTIVVDTSLLTPKPHKVKVDAIYYAVSDGAEVQFAWHSKSDDRVPFLPVGGRGKVDYGEISGVVNVAEDQTGHIEMRVLADSQTQIYTLVLDLSKHIGEERG